MELLSETDLVPVYVRVEQSRNTKARIDLSSNTNTSVDVSSNTNARLDF